MPIPLILGALLPILLKSGATILADIVEQKSPAGAIVIKEIASSLGVAPSEGAIVAKYEAEPETTAATIREVETSSPEMWAMLSNADKIRGEIIAAEQQEPAWAWGWRPGWMYLLGAFWTFTIASIALGWPHIDLSVLMTLTGAYLALYMGGHTVKSVLGK